MKNVLLSLVAISCVATISSAAEVKGKAQVYGYTEDAYGTGDLFDKGSSATGVSINLNVSEKLFDGVTANFGAFGYTDLGKDFGGSLEPLAIGANNNGKDGAYFGVANITATFGDTTAVIGRQELASPMVGSFNWLLAPSHFEAYTVVNKSVPDVTLVGTYLTKLRGNGTGSTFAKLDGDNYGIGANYSKDITGNLWFYNVDVYDYKQVYGDVSKAIGDITLAGQAVSTNYGATTDSMAYGVKASTAIDGLDLSLAYNKVEDAPTGYVQVDSLYTSSWNSFASTKVGDSFKVGAGKSFDKLKTSASYAYYDDSRYEADLILGYPVTDKVSLDGIVSKTRYNDGDKSNTAVELIAGYSF
jgi:hypothetical protein